MKIKLHDQKDRRIEITDDSARGLFRIKVSTYENLLQWEMTLDEIDLNLLTDALQRIKTKRGN